jgi:hypothetical protein
MGGLFSRGQRKADEGGSRPRGAVGKDPGSGGITSADRDNVVTLPRTVPRSGSGRLRGISSPAG